MTMDADSRVAARQAHEEWCRPDPCRLQVRSLSPCGPTWRDAADTPGEIAQSPLALEGAVTTAGLETFPRVVRTTQGSLVRPGQFQNW